MADDTTFLNTHSNFNKLKQLNNNTLTLAANWLKNYGFMLKESETQHLLFSLRNLPENFIIDKVRTLDSVKPFDIFINHNLSWGQHIDFVTQHLTRIIDLLRHLTNRIEIMPGLLTLHVFC